MNEKDFPSYYTITKSSRPEIVPIDLSEEHDEVLDFAAVGLDVDINDTHYALEGVTNELLPKVTVKNFIGKKDVSMADALEDIKKSREIPTKSLSTARIGGTFADYLSMMEKTFTKNHDENLDDELIIIDSYDGAEHKRTTKGKTGIISFNSQMISPSSISSCSPASSTNILTWQQVVGDEKFATLFPALNNIYKCKAEIRQREELEVGEGKRKHFMYDLHDGKMLYLLTQHSLFNRKHYPFLLCKCQRGAGVKDPNHKCVMISDEEHCQWYNRSLRRWKNKEADENYKEGEHMDWIDKNNYGISHFGFNSALLPRESIRFDVFHLRGGVKTG